MSIMAGYSEHIFYTTAQKFIGLGSLRETPILYNSKLIEKFRISTEKIYSIITNNIEENQQLTQLRDWLLPMLMNGQVTVT